MLACLAFRTPDDLTKFFVLIKIRMKSKSEPKTQPAEFLTHKSIPSTIFFLPSLFLFFIFYLIIKIHESWKHSKKVFHFAIKAVQTGVKMVVCRFITFFSLIFNRILLLCTLLEELATSRSTFTGRCILYSWTPWWN